MAKSGKSRRRDREQASRSRADQIRKFVFGNDQVPERPEEEHQPDKPALEPLYSLAKDLAPAFEDISHPQEMLENSQFLDGVDYLSRPGFSNQDLVILGRGDNELLSHLALVALAERDPDPALVQDLLAFMNRVGLYRRYFILCALATHAPLERGLIAEVILSNRELSGQILDVFLGFWENFLMDRLKEGEYPSFGSSLDSLSPEVVVQVASFLQHADRKELAPLDQELADWRAAHINTEALQAAGAVWGQDGQNSDGPVISHPAAQVHAAAICEGLVTSPPRATLIVGEQGCGKTAVMRLVGQQLRQHDWVIFEASGQQLIAGQKYMGDFEERLQAILDQLTGKPKVLWYVPDFASLELAGRHQFSRSSALDVLLPLVASGKIAMVGEIRPEALEQLLQDRPRLLSGFDVCRLTPLAENATLELAAHWAEAASTEGAAPLISTEVLREAWLLASQYLHDQASPGNLIDFLKLAMGRASATAGITQDDLVAALSKSTGLPAAILDDRQVLDSDGLHRFFQDRIMGQPEAVDCIISRINIIKAGLADPSRPQGVFLFAGPTGTGKTEVAKTLACFLFGSEDRLIRLDMSEFQNPAALERLTGPMDATVLDNDSLCSRIRKQPFSVVLLDEFEKAHPRVWDLFLQVFDDGRLSDHQGRSTDFRHAIILLTSNLGAHAPAGAGVGFDKADESFRASDVSRTVDRVFRREFLNRLDQVVVFRPLGREAMRNILIKELKDIQNRRGLRNRNWEVVWEESATDFLLEQGFSRELGARPLKRAVERHLLAPLAETIVQQNFPEGDQFLYIHAGGGQLAVEFIDPHAPEVADVEMGDQEPEEKRSATTPNLARTALAPSGTAAEYQFLEACLNEREAFLMSTEWQGAKDLCLSMMAVDGFWQTAERFSILGEVEYRDRLETGILTARRLFRKFEGDRSGSFNRKLMGQVALQLWLTEKAAAALDAKHPWEAFLSLEVPKGLDLPSALDLDWLQRVRKMYLGWAASRRMQIQVLEPSEEKGRPGGPVILAVSGFAAFSLLANESGLHVWEAPSTRSGKPLDHHQVLVQVAPQPEAPAGGSPAEKLQYAHQALREVSVGTPGIVRHYRELPAPLVKDRVAGWRSGRLDRVLAGNFDLLGSTEDKAPASKKEQA